MWFFIVYVAAGDWVAPPQEIVHGHFETQVQCEQSRKQDYSSFFTDACREDKNVKPAR